ncbi:pantothenate kinase [Gautieria morchelliformis]|nr:pantothenate kinase [Gautieria morchelliformis]
MAVARPSSALMSLPTPKAIKVDTRGAVILHEESPETRDSRGIYLPNYIEPVSHIAVDIGGSLAKVVYFTRSPEPLPPSRSSLNGNVQRSPSSSPGTDGCSEDVSRHLLRSGALTPLALESSSTPLEPGLSSKLAKMTLKHFPGGSLNFERFETSNLEDCVAFIRSLITRSATVNGVTEDEMKRSVKIMATGGGAHRFHELFSEELGVEVRREDEMECLIEGLGFITHIPDEVYFFSDELIHSVSHPDKTPQNPPAAYVNGSAGPSQLDVLERPSPNPPQYNVSFATDPSPQFPCLLVNIGSGVSIIKVDEGGTFERVSGTSLGGGTLWGLLSLLTPATSFDEMLALSEQGDNATVDMLVGDIYGQDYSRLGLKSTMIASSFGKVFKKGEGGQRRKFSAEDISRSLLYAISNNIGQIAYMNAEKYGLDKIYFGGCFIRGYAGYAATVTTLSYAIRFWSKGTKRALFLRHEGFLGSIGAWIKNIEVQDVDQRINGR